MITQGNSYFNSRSPAGGAIQLLKCYIYFQIISILAPYLGSDGCYFKKFFFQRNFNSRSLRGERFVLGFLTGLTAIISILASCVGSDDNRRKTHILRIEFQFSLPARGVIDSRCQLALQDIVSILAPCLGSDQRSPICHPSCHYFNSRSLPGERYHGIPAAGAPVDFNSRSLRGGDMI